jgi:predicted amidohydrolase
MFDADVGDGKSYRESASFTAGDRLKLATCGPAHIGMSICYDVRFPALYRDLALAGATLLSIPAAFTFDSGRAHWHTLLRARAIETGCFVIAPAQCGIHADGRRTYGHAMIIGPWGEILGEATTDDHVSTAGANDDVIIADLEMDATLRARQAIPSLANARPYHR